MKRIIVLLLAMLLVMMLVPTLALAATGTTYRVWDSSQLATVLTNAQAGDTIYLYAGEYGIAPTTKISKDISIVGESESDVIIKPTGSTTASSGINDNRGWVVVNAGVTLNLSKVTLNGAGFTINQGIRSNGTLIANNVTMKNINGGGSAGQGIVVYGTANILTNITMSEINRVGIGIYNSTKVNGYNYTGKGVISALDYGIEVGTVDASTTQFTVNISNVTITGNRGVVAGTPNNWGSSGILISTYFYANTGGANKQHLITVIIDHANISNCSAGVDAGLETYNKFECSDTTITHSNFFGNREDLVFAGNASSLGTFSTSENYYGGGAPVAFSEPGLTITGLDSYTTTPIPMDQNTDVTAGVEPSYIIVIPSAVDFGTLVKNSGTVTQDFDVKAQGMILEPDASIGVSVTGPFEMKDNGGAGIVPLAYALSNGTDPIPAAGGAFATFKADRIEEGSIAVNTAAISAAGSYKGTMTFTINYVPAP